MYHTTEDDLVNANYALFSSANSVPFQFCFIFQHSVVLIIVFFWCAYCLLLSCQILLWLESYWRKQSAMGQFRPQPASLCLAWGISDRTNALLNVYVTIGYYSLGTIMYIFIVGQTLSRPTSCFQPVVRLLTWYPVTDVTLFNKIIQLKLVASGF